MGFGGRWEADSLWSCAKFLSFKGMKAEKPHWLLLSSLQVCSLSRTREKSLPGLWFLLWQNGGMGRRVRSLFAFEQQEKGLCWSWLGGSQAQCCWVVLAHWALMDL